MSEMSPRGFRNGAMENIAGIHFVSHGRTTRIWEDPFPLSEDGRGARMLLAHVAKRGVDEVVERPQLGGSLLARHIRGAKALEDVGSREDEGLEEDANVATKVEESLMPFQDVPEAVLVIVADEKPNAHGFGLAGLVPRARVGVTERLCTVQIVEGGDDSVCTWLHGEGICKDAHEGVIGGKCVRKAAARHVVDLAHRSGRDPRAMIGIVRRTTFDYHE